MANPYQIDQTEDLFDFSKFDPVELRKKYDFERDKRLNANHVGKGQQQYTVIEDNPKFRHFIDDPNATPLERAPITTELEVAILGSGFGGMYAGVKLTNAGITDFRILDTAAGFGGTWWWNRYPGAACDTEAYVYLILLEETGYVPVERYTKSPEIRRHCNRIAEKWNLNERALWQTKMTELTWDEPSQRWHIKTSRGDLLKARFVINCAGLLTKPKLPNGAGIEKFKGHTFHTSRWDYKYTGGDDYGNLHNLRDKKVAIIGTGATAIQCVPYLGQDCGQLYVIQRTPSSVDTRLNVQTDPEWAKNLKKGWAKERKDNFNTVTSGMPAEVNLTNDGFTRYFARLLAMFTSNDPRKDKYPLPELIQLGDFKQMERIRARVDQVVHDPKVAESLKPYYDQWCKRPTFSDEYLQTFNRPNVTLVDTQGAGIDGITENGILVNGQEIQVDCIIWATGFELGSAFYRVADVGVRPIGRNGATLDEKWKDGMCTLMAVGVRGFPNYFVMQASQAGLGINFPEVNDRQTTWIVEVIKECKKRGVASVEPKAEAEEAWTDLVVRTSPLNKDYFRLCTPGYYNLEGNASEMNVKNSPLNGGIIAYTEILEKWVAENGFSKDMDVTYLADLTESQRARL
ncbi:hypothetical protein SmJEL517_g04039 [Synchytrium microbalum]|uniref:FAD/NAD(P)-binding domain-containing protein n=1 Tax=Synchytrium microbalum TaxID=1806994 RepID=A0A507BZW5_9FUNG|nr:uncharacterized protein SmJEL517_g04039 [Synchytrium microbalum]TPX32982.1 hypothetical protein SmJEL517_g04039 [Synchytrium microbalum]